MLVDDWWEVYVMKEIYLLFKVGKHGKFLGGVDSKKTGGVLRFVYHAWAGWVVWFPGPCLVYFHRNDGHLRQNEILFKQSNQYIFFFPVVKVSMQFVSCKYTSTSSSFHSPRRLAFQQGAFTQGHSPMLTMWVRIQFLQNHYWINILQSWKISLLMQNGHAY